jgi:hypothetical protein
MRTVHALDFEVAPWESFLGVDESFSRFRVGTCEGLWSSDRRYYRILAVNNSIPGNGHLDDVFQWFEASCVRDKKDLMIMEIMNIPFKNHLISKRGFKPFGPDNVVKSYKRMNPKPL